MFHYWVVGSERVFHRLCFSLCAGTGQSITGGLGAYLVFTPPLAEWNKFIVVSSWLVSLNHKGTDLVHVRVYCCHRFAVEALGRGR